MNPLMVLKGEFCLRLTFTLLHFLWQGVALALLALAAGALFRRAGAAARYWALVAALGMMALCLPVTFWALAPRVDSAPIGNVSPTLPPPSPGTVGAVKVLSATGRGGASVTPAVAQLRTLRNTSTPFLISLMNGLRGLVSSATYQRAAPWVAGGYFAGVLVMLARLLLALRGGRGLRGQSQPATDAALLASLARTAQAVRLRAVPAVAWCRRVAVPTVVGILKPAILLPLSVCNSLSTEQVEMLLLHELAHLRRHDHWVNLAQWAIETALFFHPAVWWLSRRIRAERELACDDLVLAAGVGQTPYAESLLRMAELSRAALAGGQVPETALTLASHGPRRSAFGQRILRLIAGREALESLRPARVWPLAVALLTLLVGGLAVACWSDALKRDTRPAQSGPVTFSSGIQAEVVGVAPNPRQGNECWAADGKPLPYIPAGFEELGGFVKAPNWISYEFYVRLTQLPDSCDVAVAHQVGGLMSSGSSPVRTKDAIRYQVCGTFKPEQKETSLRLGVATGPWERLGDTNGEGSIDGDFLFNQAFREGTTIRLVISTSENLAKDKNIRLVARDAADQQYIGSPNSSRGGENVTQTTYVINNVPAEVKIERYELQGRAYEWREIKQIALRPKNEADETNKVLTGQGQFPAARFVIDNGSHGSGSGLKGDFGPHDSKATCGWPGKISEVKWKYLGQQDGGWKFEFTRRFPIDPHAEHPEATHTTTKEIIYKGGTLEIFKDDKQWIGIEPSNPNQQNTTAGKLQIEPVGAGKAADKSMNSGHWLNEYFAMNATKALWLGHQVGRDGLSVEGIGLKARPGPPGWASNWMFTLGMQLPARPIMCAFDVEFFDAQTSKTIHVERECSQDTSSTPSRIQTFMLTPGQAGVPFRVRVAELNRKIDNTNAPIPADAIKELVFEKVFTFTEQQMEQWCGKPQIPTETAGFQMRWPADSTTDQIIRLPWAQSSKLAGEMLVGAEIVFTASDFEGTELQVNDQWFILILGLKPDAGERWKKIAEEIKRRGNLVKILDGKVLTASSTHENTLKGKPALGFPMKSKEQADAVINAIQMANSTTNARATTNTLTTNTLMTNTMTTSLLQLRWVATDAERDRAESLPPHDEKLRGRKDAALWLLKDVLLSEQDVATVEVQPSPDGKDYRVALQFKKEAADRFARITEQGIGRRLAIVVQGEVVSAPVIKEAIKDGKVTINGNFTKEEAESFVAAIKSSNPPPAPGPPVDRVRAGFRKYIGGESGISSFMDFELAWSDIPTLLELAETTEVLHEEKMVFSSLSSTIPEVEHAGVVALWLIECLRCHYRESGLTSYFEFGLISEFQKTSVMSLTIGMGRPLLPICLKRQDDNPVGLPKPEVMLSEDTHQKALAAYRAWWQKVRRLPPREAALKEPFLNTDLHWLGR